MTRRPAQSERAGPGRPAGGGEAAEYWAVTALEIPKGPVCPPLARSSVPHPNSNVCFVFRLQLFWALHQLRCACHCGGALGDCGMGSMANPSRASTSHGSIDISFVPVAFCGPGSDNQAFAILLQDTVFCRPRC